MVCWKIAPAYELAVTKDESSPMQGDAIARDTQRGAFVNFSKASGTDNTFKTVASKLEIASKRPTAETDLQTAIRSSGRHRW